MSTLLTQLTNTAIVIKIHTLAGKTPAFSF